ncbi:MAG: amidohydrolase [Bacteroidetes bacterium HGW-Bacteroidetes-12]|nr:MAG: amidohydrolase [Bacteroidetes bacterium HGW-Bacteroidetes-12]
MVKISANYIFTGITPPIKNGVITLKDDGTIIHVSENDAENIDNELIFYEGVICPGFINTHCHLELSYLYQKIPQHTSLPNFIKEVVLFRNNFPNEQRLKSIEIAEQQMIKNGIVAVGDISNGNSTFNQKSKNNLYYHTFLEVFEIIPSKAREALNNAKLVQQNYFIPNQISITPHAPYSVSNELLSLIVKETPSLLSIHNQETASENTLFKSKKGALYEQLSAFNSAIEHWNPTNKSSLQSYLPYLKKASRLLLVHNTYTTKQDIEFANANIKHLFWCFCPNANLYIENKLPNFSLFENEICTLGTDSLASNRTLSILDELKTITANSKNISLEKMIAWATINGAKFLRIENQFGSLEQGKKPGINLIQNIDLQELKLLPTSAIKKLF